MLCEPILLFCSCGTFECDARNNNNCWDHKNKQPIFGGAFIKKVSEKHFSNSQNAANMKIVSK